MTESTSRRNLGKLAGGGALAAIVAAALGEAPATARRRRVKGEHNERGNKAIMCMDGKTTRVPKKKRKKYLKRGATRGACPGTCTPSCPAGTCGDDGCGGTCACASGTICVSGTCAVCDIACTSGNGVTCGEALQAAIAAGGTVLVCPGEYVGDFTTPADVEVIGSGSGSDPASNTILRRNSANGGTVAITTAVTARLASLRITGGTFSVQTSGGVFIQNATADVTIDSCAVVDNVGNFGGGIGLYQGTLAVLNSTISGNTAVGSGGGIATDSQFSVSSTTISNNSAAVRGSGIFVNSSTTNLGPGVTISGNTANGGAGSGGGIYKLTAISVITGSATVTGNSPDNCAGSGYTC